MHAAVAGDRANVTSVNTYFANVSGSYITTNITYNDTGAVLNSTDPMNGTTTYNYDSTFTYATGATPPTPSSGVNLSTGAGYDTAHTGLPTSSTDVNGQTTTITGYDSLFRPTGYSFPTEINGVVGTGSATIVASTNETIQTRSMSGGTETRETFADAYGRTRRVAVEKASGDWYLQDTCYDANGRVSFTSYPYEAATDSVTQVCSGRGDTYTYDALGRILSVQHDDGTSFVHQYLGQTESRTNENGHKKLIKTDALGRTAAVCEITSVTLPNSGAPVDCGMDIAGTGYLTTYAYDLANHTTTVTQGSQTRTFVTDWLGRTTSVTEPESGTTTYAYSSNSTGLVVTRVKPKANQTDPTVKTTTVTQYDNASRVVSITYDDGTPTKTFSYDQATASVGGTNLGSSKGQMTSFATGSSIGFLGYDAGGRVKLLISCTTANCATGSATQQNYSFDAIGNLLSASDGTGHTTGYTYDVASEPLTASSLYGSVSTPIVSGASYGAYGLLSTTLGNGLIALNSYDGLGRPSSKYLCSGSASAGCAGGSTLYGMTATWSGKEMTSASDTVLNQSMNYGYDEFNRLASKTVTSGTTQNLTFTYDRYGNRLGQASSSGDPSVSATFNAANQITSLASSTRSAAGLPYSYDAAGNMTSDGLYTYTYDAEGNVIASSGVSSSSYVYDAMNRRIGVTNSGTTNNFVFNSSGSRVATLDSAGNVVSENVYFGGSSIALFNASGLHFQHQDHLGTARVQTTSAGAVEGSYSSLPFGDGYTASGVDQDPGHYTGLDSNNDGTVHAMFRDYSPLSGTWTSPDPYSGSYNAANPQSLNRYSYVLNSPLSYRDPSGLYCEWFTDDNPDVVEETDEGNPVDSDTCISSGGQYTDSSYDNGYTEITVSADALPGWSVDWGYYFGSDGSLAPSNPACSANDSQVVRNASVAALSNLNPSQNQANNISPLNANFAAVGNPSAINTQGWTSQASVHGSATESPFIPSQNTFVAKMYSDPKLGNTIAVVYPTMSFMHFVQAAEYELGVHVNAANARAYLGCR
ncbi:MAG: hypothetical protein PW792_08295 [Acidobacteriaceae bacterium]|nr:hypothetical protein [Acidobacteriaceae bacterium]